MLTGDRKFARQSVAHAFDLAWQRWPEVARDCDPVGWVRAAAHQFALAPWQRWLPGWAPGERLRFLVPADPFAAALLRLPPTQRLAVLLHDGLGLPLAMVAAEAEASTAATAARIVRGREALVAADVPGLDAPEGVPERLTALLAAEPPPGPPPRAATEHGVRGRGPGQGRARTPGAGTDASRARDDGAAGRTTTEADRTTMEAGGTVTTVGRTATTAGRDAEPARAGDTATAGGKASRSGGASGSGEGPGSGEASGAVDSPEGLRLASERGVRHRTAGAYALTGVIALATVTAVLLGPDTGRPHAPDGAVPGRSATPAAATGSTGSSGLGGPAETTGPPGPPGPVIHPSGAPGWMP